MIDGRGAVILSEEDVKALVRLVDRFIDYADCSNVKPILKEEHGWEVFQSLRDLAFRRDR